MTVRFYMDVHVPQAITDALRRHGVDVLTVIEDGRRREPDERLLARARDLGRCVFTQDMRFRRVTDNGKERATNSLAFLSALKSRTCTGRTLTTCC